jgi:chromosomal replication initiation ATPase DnaA
MASQIPLPLSTAPRLGRADFIVGPGNRAAVTFVDSWPDWPAPAAALIGPAGSGKSHLAGVWAMQSGAVVVEAASLAGFTGTTALVIENLDAGPLAADTEAALFALLERGQPLLLTAQEPPGLWRAALPDLKSRFAALLSFAMWAPDDALLEALAHKLFADRQLAVPGAVISQMIRSLERSPGALRDFVAKADAAALAAKKPVTTALIRALLNGDGIGRNA